MKQDKQEIQVIQQGSVRRIMRLKDTEQMCGFRRSHIYALMKQGKFPQRKMIGRRAVGWDSLEIEQWVADQLDTNF
ncbi:AlpA family phage regulatory protein [Pseudomonas qingdaonensis]|uniref:AlpA family phage regulatory protein n=1 Tax=Pseudomonas qingdaonensis TaxID=2056231 RepID=UPI002E182906|nr:AlpA family phage regulatory protein [Pseudomonas qingdaonensis]